MDNDVKMDKNERILIHFILQNLHSCPFTDDSGVDFETECVGYRETGCDECVRRNIDRLNPV